MCVHAAQAHLAEPQDALQCTCHTAMSHSYLHLNITQSAHQFLWLTANLLLLPPLPPSSLLPPTPHRPTQAPRPGCRWLIKHGPDDYKTGKVYGERPPLVISPDIYPELEAWIDTWRGAMAPQHDFLFTRQNGQPYDEASLSRSFSLAAFRLTGGCTGLAGLAGLGWLGWAGLG
jgi:hypothetical protein